MSILDGATSAGEPNAYPGTPGEFAARWNAASEDERHRAVDIIVRHSQESRRCFEMNHDRTFTALSVAQKRYTELAHAIDAFADDVDGGTVGHLDDYVSGERAIADKLRALVNPTRPEVNP